MIFNFKYYKDKRKTTFVRESNLHHMGDWRSRWERKRDLDKNKKGKDQITLIRSRGTQNDYIVTSVEGYSPDGLYFVGKPVPFPNKVSVSNVQSNKSKLSNPVDKGASPNPSYHRSYKAKKTVCHHKSYVRIKNPTLCVSCTDCDTSYKPFEFYTIHSNTGDAAKSIVDKKKIKRKAKRR